MGGHSDEFNRPGPYDMFNHSASEIERKKTMNIRTVILSAALAFVFLFVARLVTAGTEVVSDPLSEPASVLADPKGSSNQNHTTISSYRSPLDECYDVPLREAASCKNASQAPVSSYRSPLDECYDVPLRELASCRNADQASVP